MTTDLVTVIVAFLLVIGRLYTKFFITKSPGWEDCTSTRRHILLTLWLIMNDIGTSVLALFLAIARVVGDFLGRYPFARRRFTVILYR